MLIFPVLFLILLIWGLKDDEIYWKEAILWTAAFAAAFCGVLFLPGLRVPCIVISLLIVAGLLFRVVGSDIVIH